MSTPEFNLLVCPLAATWLNDHPQIVLACVKRCANDDGHKKSVAQNVARNFASRGYLDRKRAFNSRPIRTYPQIFAAAARS